MRKVVEIEEGANDFDGRTKQLFQKTSEVTISLQLQCVEGLEGSVKREKKCSVCQLWVARVWCTDCTCACGSNNTIE